MPTVALIIFFAGVLSSMASPNDSPSYNSTSAWGMCGSEPTGYYSLLILNQNRKHLKHWMMYIYFHITLILICMIYAWYLFKLTACLLLLLSHVTKFVDVNSCVFYSFNYSFKILSLKWFSFDSNNIFHDNFYIFLNF